MKVIIALSIELYCRLYLVPHTTTALVDSTVEDSINSTCINITVDTSRFYSTPVPSKNQFVNFPHVCPDPFLSPTINSASLELYEYL